MVMKLLKIRIPLKYVKPFCISAVLFGLFFIVSGNWVVGLCMLLGSCLFEKNMYHCAKCGCKLDMKMPLFKSSRCPQCMELLEK